MAEPGAFLEEFKDEEKAKLENLLFGVVVGRFYEDLALRLMEGADAGFKLAGVPVGNVEHFSVPGAYELPFAAKSFIDGVRRKNARDGGGPDLPAVMGMPRPELYRRPRQWARSVSERSWPTPHLSHCCGLTRAGTAI